VTGPCGGFVGSRGDLDLVLSEEKALPVEYSDSLAGATLLAGGRIAYWSRDGRLTLVDSLGQRTQAQLPAGSRVVAVLSEENGSALVIDGHQRRGLQLSHDGRVITERRLPVSLGQGEAIIDGAQHGRRLVLGVADTMYGRFRVVAADEPEKLSSWVGTSPPTLGCPFV
jgi:hypothetical protein